MNVFDLFATLSLDSSEYEEGLNDAEKRGANFGSGLRSAAKVGATALATVGTAALVTGKAFTSGVSNVAEYGDNIDKMSQKMGISAQAYQEWDAIMQHSGTSIEALKPSMKTLANAAEKGNDAFQKLGISEQEVASLSQEDLFAKVISSLQGMEEGTERTYITSQLLGRGATELGALLNTSAEETEAMRKRVHELGGVMSDEAVKSAAAFQDQLQDMQTGFKSLSRNMLSEFLPSMTTVMGGLTELFTGNYDEGIEKISNALDSLVSGLTSKLPDMLEVGVKILENLAQSILQNIPVILPALVDVVLGIAQAIIENLPTLITVGIQIILALVDGIVESTPELMPAITEAIILIVDKLTEPDTLVQLIDAALQIIVAIAEGLMMALPRLVEKVPKIIDNIVKTLIASLPKVVEAGLKIILALIDGILKSITKLPAAIDKVKSTVTDGILELLNSAGDWGRDLINNFIAGIKEKWQDFKNTISDMAGTVSEYLHFSEPDVGPLSNFHTYAPDMMKLFAEGIKDNEKLITNQLDKSFDFSNNIIPNSNAIITKNDRNIGSIVKSDTSSVIVNVSLEGIASEILRVVRAEAKKEYNASGNNVVVYGG